MNVSWLQLRAELRTGWASVIGLALLVALAGGAILGALAGAHRTATAYERMVADTEAFDVAVNPDNGTDSAVRFEDVAALPQVAAAARIEGAMFLPAGPTTIQEMDTFPSGMVSDGRFGFELGRSVLSEGRLPDPTRTDEVLITSEFAARRGLHAGDTLPIRAMGSTDLEQLFSAEDGAADLVADPDFGERLDLQVVGVGVAPDDLVLEAGFTPIELLLTPAYGADHDASAGWWGTGVRLRDGADVGAFEDAVQALVPDEAIAFQTRAATTEKVARTVQPYVVALLAFAAVASVLGLIVIVQAVSRRSRLHAAEHATLQALGRTHRQRFGSALVTVAVPVLVGAVGAVLVAWLLSPIAPLGAVRFAEPHPGLTFDPLVLVAGAAVFVVVVLLLSSAPLWRASRVRPSVGRRRPARSADLLAGMNVPASMSTGVRFALEAGDGSTAAPTRAVLVGATSAVALAVTLLAFGSSLSHFVETPRLFGSDWNVKIDGNLAPENEEAVVGELMDRMQAAPQVEAVSLLQVSEVEIDGNRLPTINFQPSPIPVAPTITDGRAPRGAEEIAFGQATADRLGVAIGDRVQVTDPDDNDHELAVVGTVVLPEVGTYTGSDKTSLGAGVLLDGPAFDSVAQSFDQHFAVAKVSGADPVATVQGLVPTYDNGDWLSATAAPIPAEVRNLSELRATPVVLLGMLIVLVGAAVVHALLVGFRSRRHDIAVLQALGYRPRQVVGTSLWQATTTGVIAVVVGVPLGLVVGRWIWTVLVHELAAVADPVTPVAATALLAVAVLALVNGLGLVPGWRASRRSPAATLRTE